MAKEIKTQPTEKDEQMIVVASDSAPSTFRKSGNDKKMKAEVVLPNVQGSSGGIQAKTFAYLEQQEKVVLLMPVVSGEPATITATVNDVCYLVKRGVPQLVPVQIAEMLNARLASEGFLVERSRDSKERLKAGGITM